MTSTPLKFRNPLLLLSILDYCEESSEPVPWTELLGVFGLDAGRPMKTVEGALYDLLAFGALYRTGKPRTKRTEDSRVLKMTALGTAWRERTLLPLPGEKDDPIEEADRLAHELEEDVNLLELEVSTTIGEEPSGT